MSTGNLYDTELYHQLQTGKEALGGAIHARPLRCAAIGSTWVGILLAVRCAMAAPIGEALLGGAIAAAGVFLVCLILYLAVRGQLFADHAPAARTARVPDGPRGPHDAPSCEAVNLGGLLGLGPSAQTGHPPIQRKR